MTDHVPRLISIPPLESKGRVIALDREALVNALTLLCRIKQMIKVRKVVFPHPVDVAGNAA